MLRPHFWAAIEMPPRHSRTAARYYAVVQLRNALSPFENTTPMRSAAPARGRTGRWVQLVVGLLGYGLAVPLMIRSGLGLGPWDAFHVGLHNLTGISVGVASILVGLLIVIGSFRLGVRPGPGTIANMVLIGLFIDLIMPLIPDAGGWELGLAYFVVGIILSGVATGMYIGAGLGSGPRDGLMLGVSRLRGWPVRRVRTGIEMMALLAGWGMGGTVGVGTVLFAAAIGPAVQVGLQLFGALPPVVQLPVAPRPKPRLWRKTAA